MDYVKVTKWGYEIWKSKRQVGAGVGLSILQFVKFKQPVTKDEKKLAKKGIYKLL
jgi:hypothetical protein